MRQLANCDLLARRILVNVTRPVMPPVFTASHKLFEFSQATTRVATAFTEKASPSNKNFPVSNSILQDTDSAEQKPKHSIEESREVFQRNLGRKPSNEGSGLLSEPDVEIKSLQLAPLRQDAQKSTGESVEMLPVTAAQDITQFHGTENEQNSGKNKNSPEGGPEKTLESSANLDEQNNQHGGLVGTVVFPTQAVPAHSATAHTEKPKNTGALHQKYFFKTLELQNTTKSCNP